MNYKDTLQINIIKAGDSELYFVFRLPCDGMFVSNFFKNMSDLIDVVENTKRDSQKDQFYIRNTTSEKKFHFTFKSSDKKTIGQSTTYEYSSAMDAGVKYMKNHLLRADVTNSTT